MGWASEITYFLISEPGQRVFWSFGGMRDWRGVRGVRVDRDRVGMYWDMESSLWVWLSYRTGIIPCFWRIKSVLKLMYSEICERTVIFVAWFRFIGNHSESSCFGLWVIFLGWLTGEVVDFSGRSL